MGFFSGGKKISIANVTYQTILLLSCDKLPKAKNEAKYYRHHNDVLLLNYAFSTAAVVCTALSGCIIGGYLE